MPFIRPNPWGLVDPEGMAPRDTALLEFFVRYHIRDRDGSFNRFLAARGAANFSESQWKQTARDINEIYAAKDGLAGDAARAYFYASAFMCEYYNTRSDEANKYAQEWYEKWDALLADQKAASYADIFLKDAMSLSATQRELVDALRKNVDEAVREVAQSAEYKELRNFGRSRVAMETRILEQAEHRVSGIGKVIIESAIRKLNRSRTDTHFTLKGAIKRAAADQLKAGDGGKLTEKALSEMVKDPKLQRVVRAEMSQIKGPTASLSPIKKEIGANIGDAMSSADTVVSEVKGLAQAGKYAFGALTVVAAGSAIAEISAAPAERRAEETGKVVGGWTTSIAAGDAIEAGLSVVFDLAELANPVVTLAIVLIVDFAVSTYVTGPIGETIGSELVRIFEQPRGGFSFGKGGAQPGKWAGGPDLSGMQFVDGQWIRTAYPFPGISP